MASRIMEKRQLPLAKEYKEDPSRAWVTDVARAGGGATDPLGSSYTLGPEGHGPYPLAVHTAVGGDGEAPVPGDLLCAALATCLDSTLRVVADRLRIDLERLEVRVEAEVDVRGTLCLDAGVPVAFQRMTVDLDLGLASGTAPRQRDRLIQTAEHCCVVLQTLRRAVPVALRTGSLQGRERLLSEAGQTPGLRPRAARADDGGDVSGSAGQRE